MPPFPKLSSPAILSPMAGVTDVAFRALCKRYGAGMTYTEFVSSAALVRNNAKTKELLITDPSEKPVGVQLFGSNEDEVVEAAKRVEQDFDVIDMNCGCPAHKVIKTGAGSALLNDPAKIGHLVKKVVDAVSKPVTVKIRTGIDDTSINAVEVAKAAEAAGAAAIAVHGRTQQQGYTGEADWSIVKAVKQAVKIPVIGNGDVFSAEDFWKRKQESGCDYIMVARGAIGNPRIFAEINILKSINKNIKSNSNNLSKSLNNNKNNINKNIKNTNIKCFFEYYELAQQYSIPFPQLKAHALHFTKGLPGGAKLRHALSQAQDAKALIAVMNAQVHT